MALWGSVGGQIADCERLSTVNVLGEREGLRRLGVKVATEVNKGISGDDCVFFAIWEV